MGKQKLFSLGGKVLISPTKIFFSFFAYFGGFKGGGAISKIFPLNLKKKYGLVLGFF